MRKEKTFFDYKCVSDALQNLCDGDPKTWLDFNMITLFQEIFKKTVLDGIKDWQGLFPPSGLASGSNCYSE